MSNHVAVYIPKETLEKFLETLDSASKCIAQGDMTPESRKAFSGVNFMYGYLESALKWHKKETKSE